MNFSTVPPYRVMTSVARSKYVDRSSRTASGSRPSDRVVNPTRSANSTVTSRRSAIGASYATEAAEAGLMTAAPGVAPTSAVPHSPQNRALGWLAAPQLAQTAASFVPHSPQNLRPASFADPQLGQFTRVRSSP